MELYTDPPPNATVVCVDELGPVSPAPSLPRRDGRRTAIASKHPWNTAEARRRSGSFGALRVETASSHLHRSLAQHQKLPAVARSRCQANPTATST